MSEQSIPESLLSKVRALLAKAEDPAASAEEAKAYTAKATELMAKYGIEQAILATSMPGADKPGDLVIACPTPYAGEKALLAYWLADAMRCKGILLGKEWRSGGERVHVFGFTSDLERVELLYTSLLLQMATGLAKAPVPYGQSARAYRRSWQMGFRQEVVGRVKAAEQRAAREAAPAPGRSTDLVLLDRSEQVRQAFTAMYPQTTRGRSSYSGRGYQSGREAGSRANIGQSGLVGGRRAIGGAR